MGSNMFNFANVDRSSDSTNIITFHSTAKWNAHFDAFKQTDKLMVIDFTAKWCGPCKLMDPVIQDFAAKYTDVEFIKIDVEELFEVSQRFQVQALPAFILIKKGQVVDKVVGVRKEELKRMIENHRKLTCNHDAVIKSERVCSRTFYPDHYNGTRKYLQLRFQ
ncbi:thioredoxin H2-like [Lotus japonicus]|uniref:thioredoxin H2-like n=1 Tax=Lotus japonicus TaxID=34305 RepID=UPI002585DE04|nr:thioredoxin H2-like [Lotus japonicus]